MKEKIITLLCILTTSLWANAQELIIKSFEEVTRDLTARIQPRFDENGNKSALIKVQLPIENVQFKGEIVGSVWYNVNEYWIYMSKGSKDLTVNAPSYNNLTIAFRDWDYEYLQSEVTYNLIIDIQSSVQNSSITEENGHKVVDLGLSVGWATCNIGAISPEDKGEYYAWGETSVKKDYSWKNYKYCKGNENTIFKYIKQKDNKTTLEPNDDIAHVKWGGKWRMPTPEEFQELKDNCIWEEDTIKNVRVFKITGPSGNSIIIPLTGLYPGEYWTSSFSDYYKNAATMVTIGRSSASSSYFVNPANRARCDGLNVRAVCSLR